MKRRMAFVIVILLAVQFAGAAESTWTAFGKNGNETFLLDPRRIETVQYPMGAVVGRITSPKAYKETWIRVTDADGKITRQFLWVFDCAGRAGQMAAVDLTSTQNSYDVTTSARSIGVERYLESVPPGSLYELAQQVVCKR